MDTCMFHFLADDGGVDVVAAGSVGSDQPRNEFCGGAGADEKSPLYWFRIVISQSHPL